MAHDTSDSPKISDGFDAMLDWVKEGIRDPAAHQAFTKRQWEDITLNNRIARHAIMQLSFEVGGRDPVLRGKVARALTGLLYVQEHGDMNAELEAAYTTPYAIEQELPFPVPDIVPPTPDPGEQAAAA